MEDGCGIVAAHILTGESIPKLLKKAKKICGETDPKFPKGGIWEAEYHALIGTRKYSAIQTKKKVGDIVKEYKNVTFSVQLNSTGHLITAKDGIFYDTFLPEDLPILPVSVYFVSDKEWEEKQKEKREARRNKKIEKARDIFFNS